MYTHHGYGNFSIWHKDADLWMQPTTALHPVAEKDIIKLESPRSDSYHSWSSTGKWVVLSTRREDGIYTRLYLAHFNSDGTFSKPFALPQRDPEFNRKFLFAFNVPEFTIEPVRISARRIASFIRGSKPTQVSFESKINQ